MNKTLFVIPLLYLIIALFSLPNIGIGWDTPVNLVKGEQVYNFVRTLDRSYLLDENYFAGLHKSRYFNEIPGYENGHPPAYSFLSFTSGHFLSQLFGFKYYWFHLLNVLFTTLGVYFLGKLTLILTNNLTMEKSNNSGSKINKRRNLELMLPSILAQIIIISIPSFFVYSISNTKDLPVAIASIMCTYMLLTLNKKNCVVNYVVFYLVFLLALFSKFTIVFLFPLFVYLLWIKRNEVMNIKEVFYLTIISILGLLLFFWPHLLFNFGYEVRRLFFVYFELPSNAADNYFFSYYFLKYIPFGYFALFSVSIIYSMIFYKDKKLMLAWMVPSLLYLLIINKHYQMIRQFLFIFIPFTISLSLFLNFLYDRYLKNSLYSKLITLLLVLYFSYFIFLPAHKKIFFTSMFFEEGNKDVWSLSLPLALDYAYKNHEPQKIYFSPLSFLLEYYEIREKGYEIIYNPRYTDLYITLVQVAPYEEEREIRESLYEKDINFEEGRDVLEIWKRVN